MSSENYITLLKNEYENQELSVDDLETTLRWFAKTYHSEQSCDNQHIDFAMYLTGHDRETIEQMYNDWKGDDTNEKLPCPCCRSLDTYYTQAIHCNRCAVTTEI